MTIIVFLVDTSASMNQRVYLGGPSRPRLLDVAKTAVEHFVKVNSYDHRREGKNCTKKRGILTKKI